MKMNYVLLSNGINPPSIATRRSNGIDLKLPPKSYLLNHRDFIDYRSISNEQGIKLKPKQIIKIPMGIKFEIPIGYALIAKNKSSISLQGISKLAELLDQDYTGEVYCSLINLSNLSVQFHEHRSIIQLVLIKLPKVKLNKVTTIRKSKTRFGGFGSTNN